MKYLGFGFIFFEIKIYDRNLIEEKYENHCIEIKINVNNSISFLEIFLTFYW